MRSAILISAGVFLAFPVGAQDLPPGVLLLSRTKTRLNWEFRHLETVSCMETVHREVQPPKSKVRALDTLRLEVLTNGDQELFASPGGRKFSAEQPLSYVGSGMVSNGLFGPFLKTIVLNGNASTVYKGEEEISGHRLARYEYQLAVLFSGLTIEIPEGSGQVGLHGSFWVDPQTYDVIRLDLNADNFPPALPVTEARTTIGYARTLLTDGLTVLLPQTADVRIEKESGEVSHNRVEFTQCHVFGAESTVRFNALDSTEVTPAFGAASVDDTLRSLPAGLRVSVKLRSRISGDTPVGTLIDGVVAGSVKEKSTPLIADGSPVRGRIRRMEYYRDPFPYFVVGLEFTEVEAEGIRYLFYADLVDLGPAPGVERTISTAANVDTARNQMPQAGTITTETREKIFVPDLPGVAVFFYRGSTLHLPQDFPTVWKTRPVRP